MKELTKKQKQTLLNILMIFIIFVCVAAGVFFVAFQKGWFEKPAEQLDNKSLQQTITVTTIRGEVTILRNGISFYPENDAVLMSNDILSTGNQSTCELHLDNSFVYINAQTKLELSNIDCGTLEFALLEGDLIADINSSSNVTFTANNKQFSATKKYFSLNASGDYSEDFSTSSENKKEPAQKDEKNKDDKPDKVNHTNANKDKNKDENKKDNKEEKDSDKKNTNKKEEKPEKKDNNNKQEDKKPDKDKPVATPTPDNICTISIYCDEILGSMDKLAEGKDKFVPANGCILKKTEVEFKDGDTAFDILKKVCESNNIPLEYSWTPGVDSYYVEGINHLYEFDCGDTSGWLFDVNGERPIRGSSYYEVKSGDNFVWHYTLTLGSKPS